MSEFHFTLKIGSGRKLPSLKKRISVVGEISDILGNGKFTVNGAGF